MKKIIVAALFVFVFATASWALTFFDEVNTGGVGVSFTLSNLSGEKVSLNSYKDKPVILFFWTTWCPHCRDAIVDIQKNYKQMEQDGVTMLAIDINESKAKVESFAKQHGISFPILLDSDGKVAVQYRVQGVPTFVLLSKQGKIALETHAFPDRYKEILAK